MKKVIGTVLTAVMFGSLLSGCYTRACEKAQLVYKEQNYHEEAVVHHKKGVSYHHKKSMKLKKPAVAPVTQTSQNTDQTAKDTNPTASY